MKSLITILICFITISINTYASIPSFNWLPKKNQPDLNWAKNVGAKSFPLGKRYKVDAVGDGKTLCTEKVQASIDLCARQGGGTVEFADGKYLIGAIFLQSGVNLHIGKNVTLLAISDLTQFPKIQTRIAGIEMTWPAAVINVLDKENVAITGDGKLECQGKVYWDKYWAMRKDYEQRGLRWIVDYDCDRVRGILISRSENVSLKNIAIRQSGFWAIQMLYSQQCTVDGVNIQNNIDGRGPSTDGIDIDSSTNILVQNCEIDCNDDNICLKAGRDWDGLRVGKPTQNIVIRDCIAYQGAGLVTCGSETSGGISNILCYNLKSKGTSVAIRFKSAMNRGGFIKNIYFSNIEAEDVRTVISAELNWNPSYSYSVLPKEYEGKEIPEHWKTMLKQVTPPENGYPKVSDIYISNVNAKSCTGNFISASGMGEKLPLKNLWLHNIKGNAAKAGQIKNVENITLNDVVLSIEDGSQITLENNKNITGKIQYKENNLSDSPFTYSLNQNDSSQKTIACKYPEFAFLFPEMAGNFKLGIIIDKNSYWLKDFKEIKLSKSGNKLTYKIADADKMKGSLEIDVCSLNDSDGLILRVSGTSIPSDTELFWSFGGAYGKTTNLPMLKPLFCKDNVFSVEGNAFTLYYGESMALKVIQGIVPENSDIRLSDAYNQTTPLDFLYSGKKTDAPALAAKVTVKANEDYYFCFYKQNTKADYNYFLLPDLFKKEFKQ